MNRGPQGHAPQGDRTGEFLLIADRPVDVSDGNRRRLPLQFGSDQRPAGRIEFASFAMLAMPVHCSGHGAYATLRVGQRGIVGISCRRFRPAVDAILGVLSCVMACSMFVSPMIRGRINPQGAALLGVAMVLLVVYMTGRTNEGWRFRSLLCARIFPK